MKKILLSTLLLVLPMLASAYDCQVDGIYYNLIPKGNLAEVTSGDTKYSDEVTIPEKFTYEGVEYSVTSIGNEAFYYCSGLTSVTIPNSVTTIGNGAFLYCSSLTTMTIPNSVTTIGGSAFRYCSGLTSVTIPNSVITIGGGAFNECTSLTSLTIPNSVTSIGSSAFAYCSGLTSVTIPNSVTSIGSYAFQNCSGLTSVTIPNSVTSIERYAFQNCSGLTSVTIPNSVTSIESSAFRGCTSLTSVTIPNSVTSIERSAFESCSGLTSVTIPNSVTTIGYYAFYGCSGLTSVTIPNSVTTIEIQTFNGCTSLTSVTIPNSVTSIGDRAFAECSKLEEVYCLAEKVPSTYTNAFEKSYPEYTTLYVPAASINDYKTTEPWSYFGTIKASSGTGEEPQKCVTPTISYGGKRLTFSCETEGVEYVYEIKDADIKKGYDAAVDLTATYEISVYATKAGYENSDIATATLVWTNAIFTETTEPSTSAKAVTESIPVLISAQGGTITVKCEQEGQPVAVYSADGKALGNATVSGGQATIATPLQKGQVAIVKVGNRSVKIAM